MTDVSATFGFEIIQKLYDNEIQKKEDVIILFIHWYLIKSGFRCIGIGNENVFNASEKGSELFPTEWNKNPNYALRYIKNGTLYVLSGIKSDNDLLVNFLKFENESISNIHFPIEDTVAALHGSLETVMPSYQTILHNIRKDLVSPVYQGNTSEATTQTAQGTEVTYTSRNSDLRNPIIPGRISSPYHPIVPDDPLRVGGADLFPGGQGGGMIFDPFSNRPTVGRSPSSSGYLGVPGRLPPGAVPPGARFDPFGPIDVDVPVRPHRRRPDDDHLPPPGAFYGDMFM